MNKHENGAASPQQYAGRRLLKLLAVGMLVFAGMLAGYTGYWLIVHGPSAYADAIRISEIKQFLKNFETKDLGE